MSKSIYTSTSSESDDTASTTTYGTANAAATSSDATVCAAAASGGGSAAAGTTTSLSYSETTESSHSKSFEEEFMEAFRPNNQSKLIELVGRATEERINTPIYGSLLMINYLKGEALDALLERPDLKINFYHHDLGGYTGDLPVFHHISNLSILEKLIKKVTIPYINTVNDERGFLPIEYALNQRNIESLKVLLKSGAEVTPNMITTINKDWFGKSEGESDIKALINAHLISQGSDQATADSGSSATTVAATGGSAAPTGGGSAAAGTGESSQVGGGAGAGAGSKPTTQPIAFAFDLADESYAKLVANLGKVPEAQSAAEFAEASAATLSATAYAKALCRESATAGYGASASAASHYEEEVAADSSMHGTLTGHIDGTTGESNT